MSGRPSSSSKALIFISHASEDLPSVRQVRNYLEDCGAAPLLFHLVSLTDPQQFWPLIENEIAARNYFLFCDSEAARASEWVRRERHTVNEVAKSRPVRVGTIDVDRAKLDRRVLDHFLEKMKVYVGRDLTRRHEMAVAPYVSAMRMHGLEVTDFEEDAEQIVAFGSLRAASAYARKHSDNEIRLAAQAGWVVLFVCKESAARQQLRLELKTAEKRNAGIVPVYLDPPECIPNSETMSRLRRYDGLVAIEGRNNAKILVDLLMTM